jgi:hypothetical protein
MPLNSAMPAMQTYEIVYFTHAATLPGQNPWWGPYTEYLRAPSLRDAMRKAEHAYDHVEIVRRVEE